MKSDSGERPKRQRRVKMMSVMQGLTQGHRDTHGYGALGSQSRSILEALVYYGCADMALSEVYNPSALTRGLRET